MPQLISHLDESLKRLARAWEIHFQIILPSFLALSLFDELYRELFGNDDSFGAFRLLQGFDNKYLEADRALWELSRLALTLPTVSQALETCTAAEVIPTLQHSPEGHIFLAELGAYLDEYGQRSHTADGLSAVSWITTSRTIMLRRSATSARMRAISATVAFTHAAARGRRSARNSSV